MANGITGINKPQPQQVMWNPETKQYGYYQNARPYNSSTAMYPGAAVYANQGKFIPIDQQPGVTPKQASWSNVSTNYVPPQQLIAQLAAASLLNANGVSSSDSTSKGSSK